MAKKQLSTEQKRLDTDIWINHLISIVKDNSISVICCFTRSALPFGE